MRVLIGIILGVIITVGGAYLYDFTPYGDEFRQRDQRATSDGELGRCQQQMGPPHRAGPCRVEPARRQNLNDCPG